MPASLLIAEDQADIRDLLVLNLSQAGYDVTAVADGAAALAAQTQSPRDLLLLDLMLPGLDGLEVCKSLRARGSSTPILMLTAKSTELDRVLGLELGADDYLTKPFSLPELLARVKALLRRKKKPRPNNRRKLQRPRFAMASCTSFPSSARFNSRADCWTSPRWSSICSCTLPNTLGMCFRAASCWTPCGVTATRVMSTR
jgi:DNA-binding response OmpR family regulator